MSALRITTHWMYHSTLSHTNEIHSMERRKKTTQLMKWLHSDCRLCGTNTTDYRKIQLRAFFLLLVTEFFSTHSFYNNFQRFGCCFFSLSRQFEPLSFDCILKCVSTVIQSLETVTKNAYFMFGLHCIVMIL